MKNLVSQVKLVCHKQKWNFPTQLPTNEIGKIIGRRDTLFLSEAYH